VTGGADGEAAGRDLERVGVASSDYEGPTTILSLISQGALKRGMESLTMIVHLPQYTQLGEDYMGVVRLEDIISSLYGIRVDEESIAKAERQREHITDEVANNPQMQEILQQLESTYDAGIGERKEEEKPRALSPEIEEFLREMERRFRRE
jgi:hypothetical protein